MNFGFVHEIFQWWTAAMHRGSQQKSQATREDYLDVVGTVLPNALAMADVLLYRSSPLS
jgi:hypothetical protein